MKVVHRDTYTVRNTLLTIVRKISLLEDAEAAEASSPDFAEKKTEKF